MQNGIDNDPRQLDVEGHINAASGPIKQTRLPQKDYASVKARVLEVCSKDEDGYAKYKPGFTDVRLADELGYPVGAIARVRKEEIGKTRERGLNRLVQAADPAQKTQIEAMAAQLEKLIQLIDAQAAMTAAIIKEMSDRDGRHEEQIGSLKKLVDKHIKESREKYENLRYHVGNQYKNLRLSVPKDLDDAVRR